MNTRWNLRRHADDDVIDGLDGLVGTEKQRTADVLAHLAEVDARTLYAGQGYSSIARYVVERLGYCEGGARRRITAARLARRFPVIFERVAAGAIHLSGLTVIGPHLTAANHVELLDAAGGKTKRQIEELVAARSPKSDVLPMIAPLPPPPVAPTPHTDSSPKSTTGHVVGTAPLSAESFSITFTIDRRTRDCLAEAQALLGHTVGNGDTGAIVSRALVVLVAQLRKNKFAETAAPRAARATRPGSRHIPAAVKRHVAQRDGHACTFVADDGHRCDETARLEYHHEEPFGRGGPSTVSNVRLLCATRATHNALLAERDYGCDHIESRKRERAEARPRIAVPNELLALARTGLCQLGFNQPVARRAVGRAAAELDAGTSLEALIRCSLRHTRAPQPQ